MFMSSTEIPATICAAVSSLAIFILLQKVSYRFFKRFAKGAVPLLNIRAAQGHEHVALFPQRKALVVAAVVAKGVVVRAVGDEFAVAILYLGMFTLHRLYRRRGRLGPGRAVQHPAVAAVLVADVLLATAKVALGHNALSACHSSSPLNLLPHHAISTSSMSAALCMSAGPVQQLVALRMERRLISPGTLMISTPGSITKNSA